MEQDKKTGDNAAKKKNEITNAKKRLHTEKVSSVYCVVSLFARGVTEVCPEYHEGLSIQDVRTHFWSRLGPGECVRENRFE